MIASLLLLAAAQIALTEVTDEAGVDFAHDPVAEGRLLLPEIMGSGLGLLDYDADGDLDLYLVQSGAGGNRLFRQTDAGTFEDVTESAGVGDTGYGMGVAVGDIDNDGLVDLYVTNYGPDRLFRNEGGGRFSDVTESHGIAGDDWSASATFCDYDADGFLDLYVTHYVANDENKSCTHSDGSPDYCSPQVFSGTPDTLYRNEGGGRFVDVSARSGIREARAPGLGVLCADLNDDGFMDFYVANDGEANQLWQGDGSGRFVDEALMLGVALDSRGQPEAGMGITAGDVDEDGDLDLFMTHIINQTNTLYVNDGEIGFEDRSQASGLGASSLALTGFGTGFLDVDHDGDLDLAIVNGRIKRDVPLEGAAMSAFWNAYAEPNQLLINEGGGRFEDRSESAGDFGVPIEITRGLALGDLDDDGDLDLVIVSTAAPSRVYRNDAEKSGGWLFVRAMEGKRDSHGALVTVTAGAERFIRIASPGYGYLSSNDPRAHFGLPAGASIESIEVRWPDGSRETFEGGAPNRTVVLVKGAGR